SRDGRDAASARAPRSAAARAPAARGCGAASPTILRTGHVASNVATSLTAARADRSRRIPRRSARRVLPASVHCGACGGCTTRRAAPLHGRGEIRGTTASAGGQARGTSGAERGQEVMHMVPGTLMGSTGISPEIFAAIVEPVLLVLAAVGFGALVTIVIAITTHLGRTTG